MAYRKLVVNCLIIIGLSACAVAKGYGDSYRYGGYYGQRNLYYYQQPRQLIYYRPGYWIARPVGGGAAIGGGATAGGLSGSGGAAGLIISVVVLCGVQFCGGQNPGYNIPGKTDPPQVNWQTFSRNVSFTARYFGTRYYCFFDCKSARCKHYPRFRFRVVNKQNYKMKS